MWERVCTLHVYVSDLIVKPQRKLYQSVVVLWFLACGTDCIGRFYPITSAMSCIYDTGMIVYQVTENFPSNESTSANEDRIHEESKIYRKDDKRSLSDYQKVITSAAGDTCVRDPTMLTKEGELLALAKEQVFESRFQFKKGKPR